MASPGQQITSKSVVMLIFVGMWRIRKALVAHFGVVGTVPHRWVHLLATLVALVFELEVRVSRLGCPRTQRSP